MKPLLMKLYGSSRSPFARKVMLAAHELGLAQQIELVPTTVSVLQADPVLVQLNPLGQVPTLVLDGGLVIPDSLLICEYLDSIASQPGLFPPGSVRRYEALARHAIGQGMMETLVKLFGERKRVDDPLQPSYVAAYRQKFHRAVTAMNAVCGDRAGQAVDIGDLALACALAYADFRFPELSWRTGQPALNDWYAAFAQRAAMRATEFVVPTA